MVLADGPELGLSGFIDGAFITTATLVTLSDGATAAAVQPAMLFPVPSSVASLIFSILGG